MCISHILWDMWPHSVIMNIYQVLARLLHLCHKVSHSFDGQFSSLKPHRAQILMMTTNMKKCQLSGPGIEANLQISGGKAVETWTCPILKGVCA